MGSASSSGISFLVFGLLLLCLPYNEADNLRVERGAEWPPPPTNMRPIIGVLAQEVDPRSSSYRFGDTFIMATYFKYLEMAGARVVPIRVGENGTYYITLFKQINGLLLPGGSANLTTSLFAKASELLFHLALEVNAVGDYFPVWGTCQGFEMLAAMIGGGEHILETCDAENYLIPLVLDKGAKSGAMFKDIPTDLLNIASAYNITPNFHHFCLTPKTFDSNKELSQFFTVLSTNQDRSGKAFISMIEGKNMPIYGSQWHPEKIGFVWDVSKNINHSLGAVRLQQYLGNFFVNEARRSTHHFTDSAAEGAALIENFHPIYLGAPTFSLNYYFNLTKPAFHESGSTLCKAAESVKNVFCRSD